MLKTSNYNELKHIKIYSDASGMWNLKFEILCSFNYFHIRVCRLITGYRLSLLPRPSRSRLLLPRNYYVTKISIVGGPSKVAGGGPNPPNPACHPSISISIASLPHICIGNATKFVPLKTFLKMKILLNFLSFDAFGWDIIRVFKSWIFWYSNTDDRC